MSDKQTNVLITILIILLPIAAFSAGWFTNDLIEVRYPQWTTSAISDEGDLALVWEAWGHVENKFIGDIPSGTQFSYGLIRGALAQLNDPYTIFLEPVAREEEQITLGGVFGGIGAYINRNEDGDAVLTIIPGNPAEAAGILDGDILVAIDGEPVDLEMPANEIGALVRGEIGSIVVLTVIHPGEADPVDVEIERGEILVPSVISRILPDEPTVGYIQLSRFSGESLDEMIAALDELETLGAEKLVLDLRGNSGGLLDAAVDVADLFVEEGTLLIQESRADGERIYSANRRTTVAPDIPMVVLVDGGTASAAEILAGALQDRGRARLVGQRTFGKGSVQLVYDLSDGSSIHVTSARWFTPERRQIDQQGLPPDFEVVVPPEAVEAGIDEILRQAVELLVSQD